MCFFGKDLLFIFKIVYGNELIFEYGDRLKVGINNWVYMNLCFLKLFNSLFMLMFVKLRLIFWILWKLLFLVWIVGLIVGFFKFGKFVIVGRMFMINELFVIIIIFLLLMFWYIFLYRFMFCYCDGLWWINYGC